jgi:glyoxylase-like metal-dependent hydrolase (beta-lactamase superfamily II)
MNAVLTPTDVAPGVSMLSLRTPTLPPATHTNAYLIGTGELVLIEPASPYPEELAQAEAWIAGHLGRGQRLRALLLTHHHPDHVGGAEAMRQRFGVEIWAHERTAERLHGQLRIDRLLQHGERIELDGPTPMSLEAVYTPGHAPGHLCYLEPASGSLVAGDMVAGVGTILIEKTDGDMQLYLESLRAMAALDATRLLPAHGFPIDDPAAKLAFYVQHRLAREAKVEAALRAEPQTIEQLLPIAYADTPRAAWPFARLALEAHLIKLVREGRADEQGQRYSAGRL